MFTSEVTFVWPYLLSATISIVLLLLAWQKRKTTISWPFMLLMVISAGWSLMAGMPFLFGTLVNDLVWANTKIVFIAVLPVAWVILAASYYTHGKRSSPTLAASLLIVPFITIVLLATDPSFGTILSDSGQHATDMLAESQRALGVWYWVQTIYSYTLIALGVGLYFRTVLSRSKQFRKHALFVAVGAVVPLITIGLYHSDSLQVMNLDLTPIGFSLSGVFFAWGLFRYRMLDLIPFTRAAVITLMDDALIVLDSNGIMVDINPAGEAVLGCSHGDVTGEHIETTSTLLAKNWNSYRSDDKQAQRELALGNGDDHRWYDVNIKQMRRLRRREQEWLLVLRDVSYRKKTENELREAKVQAEEHSRLKSVFITNMSHEIRTPLAGIIGTAQVLSEELADEHQIFSELIQESAQRLLRTLDSVLDASRLSADQIELCEKTVNVTELTSNVVAEFSAEATRKGLKLDLTSDDSQTDAFLDVEMSEKAIRHVLDNAIKYTDTGSVSLRVTSDGGFIHICVHDTGSGISPDFMPHIFDTFRQESAGETRSYQGAGLGLSVARGMIHRMGGSLKLESELGRGTRVTISLPVKMWTPDRSDRHAVKHGQKNRGADLPADSRHASES